MKTIAKSSSTSGDTSDTRERLTVVTRGVQLPVVRGQVGRVQFARARPNR